ncbi:hypothetical protein BH11MYX3_BH11MYX3_37200 [soil metagenome]
MFLFRSLTIGLLGACMMLLVRIEPARLQVQPTSSPEPQPQVVANASIVDVAPGLRGAEVSSLIRLAPGERVIAVDDRPVDSDLAAGAAIAMRAPGSGGYVDLEVERPDGLHRRVLVLMH